MPNSPKPDTVSLHASVPKRLKRTGEQLALVNKDRTDNGPATLTDIVIAALDEYYQRHVPDYSSIRAPEVALVQQHEQ